MIKINLANKKSLGGQDQMAQLKDKTKTFINILERFKLVGAGQAQSTDTRGPIIRLVSAVAICYFAESFVDDFKQGELDKLNKILEVHKKEQKTAKAEVDKIKSFEPVKKQLEDFEAILNAKLDVVNELMASRSQTIKMLYALSSSLPPDVWVKTFKKNKDDLTISGGALEFNYVSDFMKNLGSNTYFGNVQPKFQKNERTPGGVQFVNFELLVKRGKGGN